MKGERVHMFVRVGRSVRYHEALLVLSFVSFNEVGKACRAQKTTSGIPNPYESITEHRVDIAETFHHSRIVDRECSSAFSDGLSCVSVAAWYSSICTSKMERRNVVAILLLVFGIIGVYCYPSNSIVVPAESDLELSPEVADDYSFANDEKPDSAFPRVDHPYEVDGRSKRSPGGLDNIEMPTNVLRARTLTQIDRQELLRQLRSFTEILLQQNPNLSYDEAYSRARHEHPDIEQQLYEAYDIDEPEI
ncbi:uncharacterized protein [Venturia canescens]|uniref:uncharacterized protein n=1 Tax=Venturia canescens TaxID=32260 RepID=UPI001C9C7C77|nr:uncharacterized protein LOC122412122 [Venturia canescens]